MVDTKRGTATRYEIEWCSDIPDDENGDSDMDRAVYERRYFDTFAEATAAAWIILRDGAGKLPWEIVIIEKQSRRINEDILRYEGIRRFMWERAERWEVTEDTQAPASID